MLTRYGERLATVEAHNTFRRRPRPETLAAWAAAVPPSFRFGLKAHVAITHQRDLEGVEDRIAGFYAGLDPLGDRRGPVLFQLPHKQPDYERLDRLLDALPAGGLAAFELHAGWHDSATYDRLDAAGATVVVVDDGDRPPPVPTVGPVAYVRLRRPRYTRRTLDAWAVSLRAVADAGRPAFAYVRHDDEGDAPAWAASLAAAVAS
jgi:uncharacterized protein YecE (DUF72 family)